MRWHERERAGSASKAIKGREEEEEVSRRPRDG